MNRQQRVLGYLKRRTGICVQDVPRDIAYTLRNAISELRAAGVKINSEVCTFHHHPNPVKRYKLAGKPVQQEIQL